MLVLTHFTFDLLLLEKEPASECRSDKSNFTVSFEMRYFIKDNESRKMVKGDLFLLDEKSFLLVKVHGPLN